MRERTKQRADLRVHRHHAFPRPEVKQRLVPHINQIGKAYGLRVKWIGDVCYFEGPARGYLKVMDDSVLLLARFTTTARLFKAAIEQGIHEILNKALE